MQKVIILLTVLCSTLLFSKTTFAQVDVSFNVRIAPPELPVYEQPMCPQEGYLWTPGYWAWSPDAYYWVPGVWLAPPQVGFLWRPGYWGSEGGFYGWHHGYWGEHVGFYGGVCYGYGYGGSGFYGGRWEGGAYRYNTAVCRVNTTVIHNVYVDNTVVHNTVVNHTSFNGEGGIRAQPNNEERSAMAEHHVEATSVQHSHEENASKDKNQFAAVNHGQPATAAMNKPGGERFNNQGKAAPAAAPINRPTGAVKAAPTNRPQTAAHAQQGGARPQPTPNTGVRSQPAPSNAARPQQTAPRPQGATARPQQSAPRPQSQQMNRTQPQQMNRQAAPQMNRQAAPQMNRQTAPQQMSRPVPQQSAPRMAAPQPQHMNAAPAARPMGGGEGGGGHEGHH